MEHLIETRKSGEIFTGKWCNQHNSEMDLTICADGLISGIFTTSVQGREPEHFPLTGFACRGLISFCVRFEEHACVTSWVGQLAPTNEHNEIEALHTLWHMTVDLGDSLPEFSYKSFLSGADQFVRGARRHTNAKVGGPTSHPLCFARKT